MKTITSHDQRNYLRQHGVLILTGEACGVGMRLLCDLTQEGTELVTEFLGSNVLFQEQSNWNSQDNQVASVMFSRNTLRELTIYALLQEYEVVGEIHDDAGNGLVAMAFVEWEEIRDKTPRKRELIKHTWFRSGTAHDGMRNRHEFSGRTV